MKAKQCIGLTQDRTQAVDGYSSSAYWQLAGVGCEISDEDARRYGIVEGYLPGHAPAVVAAPAGPDKPGGDRSGLTIVTLKDQDPAKKLDPPKAPEKCHGITKQQTPCKSDALENGYCRQHQAE
jgi:hypothetical protein